jgi:hypothetical protein
LQPYGHFHALLVAQHGDPHNFTDGNAHAIAGGWMLLLKVVTWLAGQPWSVALHESLYGYPIVESIHVWALCLFVGLTIVLDLRLTGLAFRHVPVSEIVERILPWQIAGFVIMIASGALLFYAIPVRSYQNIFFRVKLVLLVIAGLNVWIFNAGVYRRIQAWDRDPVPPPRARSAGFASLALWIAIIFCGRMIAYNWFDCDKQPQPAVINALAGCMAAAP